MKTVTIKPFGVEVDYSIPSTLAEMVEKAGGGTAGEEVVRELAHRQFLYHTAMGAIRSGLVAAVEEAGTYARKYFNGKAGEIFLSGEDGDGNPTFTNDKGKAVKDPTVRRETDDVFIRRIAAEQGFEVSDLYKSQIQDITNETTYDLTVKERTVAEKKLAKVYLEAAKEIVDNGQTDHIAARLGELLGRTVDVSNPDTAITVLAAAIRDNEARERQAVKSKYLNL